MDPIDVVFAIPEDKIQSILEHTQNNEKLTVIALDREEGRELSVGVLSALDSQVDTATGTVKCKAEFSNKKSLLFPNQFVNVRLLLEVRHDALLVPSSAVQNGTNGSFVFVVKNDKSVTIQPVKVGPTEGGNIAIESNLKAGEIVVIDGTDRLREGSKIEIMQRVAAPAANTQTIVNGAQPQGKKQEEQVLPRAQ
jgi:multidrug efflux system membrane fusion protein